MAIPGERFTLDFDDDEDTDNAGASNSMAAMASALSSSFVGDIKERVISAVKPPSAPVMKQTTTGFPEHRKRTRVSAFKQQRASANAGSDATSKNISASPAAQAISKANNVPLTQNPPSFEDAERQRIDEENRQRLADMSAEEIESERQELMASLDPSLIRRLLMRANLDEGRGDTGFDPNPAPAPAVKSETTTEMRTPEGEEAVPVPQPAAKPETTTNAKPSDDKEAVSIPRPAGKNVRAVKTVTFADDDAPPTVPPPDLKPATAPRDEIQASQPHVHYPTAPSVPDLDPADPNFLENLHNKYFPTLPADPSKLAWMAPLPTSGSIEDQNSPYSPAQQALAAQALRFDFRGALLPPRIARAMPSNRGLHHHGEAPEAAGYTVPELARLARSAFPAQRCIAFQTLGRVLYRLGRGDYGGTESEMARGIWGCVEEGKVVETLKEAAAKEGGHQSSRVYATEALWLWQKGGGKVWKAG